MKILLEILGIFFFLILTALVGAWIFFRKFNSRIACPCCGSLYYFDYQLKREMKGENFDSRIVKCEACHKNFEIIRKGSMVIGVDASFEARKID